MNEAMITLSTPSPLSAVARREHVELTVSGMTCAHCPPTIEKALKEINGVVSARVNLANQIAAIDYNANRVDIADLARAIRVTGYVVGAAKIRVFVAHMHCASCVTRAESALKSTPGVIAATANLGTSAVDIEYDPQKTDFGAIHAAIEASGHRVAERRTQDIKVAVETGADPEQIAREQEYVTLMHKFWFAAIISAPVMALSYPDLIPGL
ncbi:MAG: copper ion binding protein, partial [Methylocystis sp.]